MIVLDGVEYNLKFVAVTLNYEYREKYRLMDGTGREHRELNGIYEIIDMEFGPSLEDPATFAALILKLLEPVEWHTLSIPSLLGDRTIEGRFDDFSQNLLKQIDVDTIWDGFTLTFLARQKRSLGA